jgi:hypothetical protein
MTAPADEDYLDHHAATRDLVDLMNQLADALGNLAHAGNFERHASSLIKCEAVLVRARRSISLPALLAHEHEASRAVSRLHTQLQLIDCVGRA